MFKLLAISIILHKSHNRVSDIITHVTLNTINVVHKYKVPEPNLDINLA